MLLVVKPLVDLLVVTILWIYFIFGFAVFFLPLYLFSYAFSRHRELSFQKLNHRFFRVFLFLCRILTPGLMVHIPDEIRQIRSSIIISNHVSYLDPLFLMSLFKKHKTIVKNRFFNVPLFGWVIKQAGYLPSSVQGQGKHLMIKHILEMKDYLATGGNLFVFPEGTRSRDGRIGSFEKGVFGIAKRCQAPIRLLYISNTEKLFQPGKFFFNTCVPINIRIEHFDTIETDNRNDSFDELALMNRIRALYEHKNQHPN
jgi:1-acyl-sn-glycerol-3-phosphate acyltransferase